MAHAASSPHHDQNVPPRPETPQHLSETLQGPRAMGLMSDTILPQTTIATSSISMDVEQPSLHVPGQRSSSMDPPWSHETEHSQQEHPTSSPMPIKSAHNTGSTTASPTAITQGVEAEAVETRAPNISFSTIPHHVERLLPESYPSRLSPEPGGHFHEYTPSPTRSLAHVLETAEAQGLSFEERRPGNAASSTQVLTDERWLESAPGISGSSVGTTGVHFQPQRGHFMGRRARTGSGSGGFLGTSMPESRFSEFEVVYDDGVRKQRTFSLTTQMDDDIEDSDRRNSDDHGSENSPLLVYSDTHMNGTSQLGASSLLGGHASAQGAAQGTSLHAHHINIQASGQSKLFPHYGSYNATSRYHPPTTPLSCFTQSVSRVWHSVREFRLTTPQKRIFKASLAYLFACLVSFTPLFHPYIGASGHLAASAAVFFNPAKSLGRMVDAAVVGLCAIAFGVLVSVASLLSAIWFNKYDQYILGHVVSVIVFGGGSTFIIAYAKAYYNRPNVNVGNLYIGAYYDFESAHEKLRQDMAKSLGSFRVLLKLLTKTFLLENDMTPFGSESVQRLIESQVESFSALANSLEEAQLEYPAIDIKKYEQCVRSLSTLAQYLNGLRSSCGLQYDMLKKDEQRNSQAPDSQSSTLSGARGRGIGMRMSSFSLIGSLSSDRDQSASADLIEFLDHVGKPMKSLALTCKLTIEHLQEIFSNSDSERGELLAQKISKNRRSQQLPRQSGYESGEMFSDATAEASATGVHPGRSGSDSRKHPSLALMQLNLAKALDIFEAANSKALKRFYSHQSKRRSGYFARPLGPKKHMSAPSLQDLSARDGMDPEPGLADSQDALTEKAPVGEQIFLIYFFVFNLMEFSKELAHLVSCVEILVGGDEDLTLWIARNQQTWWRRIWFLLTGFPRRLRKVTPAQDVFDSFDTEPGLHPSSARMDSQGQGSGQSPSESHPVSGATGANLWRKGQKPRLFPKPNIHNTNNTLHTPTPSTFMQKWSTRLWKFLHVFRSFQVKYAAKTAISTMVLLVPAFVDWTRPYFVQYRGEWALISMLIIMVPTVGGTNIVGLYRILGTVIGCYVGVAVYLLFPADDILLPVCCFLFAVPNFYLVLCSSYPRIGQVTLLAFNLVLIQTYNRRNGDGTVPPDDDDNDDDGISGSPFSARRTLRAAGSMTTDPHPNNPGSVSDVWTIAFHRAVAVSLGVVIGVAVTSYVWPYEARVELRKGLSDLLLNISWLYNRLVSVYSTNLDRVSMVPSQERSQQSRFRLQALLKKTTFQERFQNPEVEINRTINGEGEMDIEMMNKEFMAIELSLQLQLLQLYALLEETPNEPRLKGKFPVATYKNMLGSCQNILDRFLSMRLVITKDQWLESARRDFIVPVNKERREMVGNVLLYFYTIASALRLKTPLPPYLPPANNARLRLIQKIRQLPVVQNKVVLTEDSDDRYIFYYAYALVMDDVIRELERLGQWSQDLFGVITPASEFEAWFTDDGHAPSSPPPVQLPSSATRAAPLSPQRDIDEPYRYPEPVPESFSRSRSQQQPFFTSPENIHRYNASPGTSFGQSASLLASTNLGHGTQYSEDGRDRLFTFDPQDPFRDSRSIQSGPEEAEPVIRDGRRTGSSQSLNSATSRSQSRNSQNPRSGSGYGTMSHPIPWSADISSGRNSVGYGHLKNRSSLDLRGGSLQSATSGFGGQHGRPLTTSISASRLNQPDQQPARGSHQIRSKSETSSRSDLAVKVDEPAKNDDEDQPSAQILPWA
ncbi:MAG: hypothetical protein BYD32DRAFT_466658 [Podila humilis]|nr:MAG: hypothetical protein BYD32DRAFT_466658 [Podila humilis]